MLHHALNMSVVRELDSLQADVPVQGGNRAKKILCPTHQPPVRLLVAAASSAHKVACVRREVCKVQSPDDLHPMAVWKKTDSSCVDFVAAV